MYSKEFNSEQAKIEANEHKTINLSLTVPIELPFRSTASVPESTDKSFYFSDIDYPVAQLMPPSCETKHFDIRYEAKVSVRHGVIGKKKKSEFFSLNFRQVKQA